MDKKVTLIKSLKKRDFILKSKMAELYQNKNSKQPDLPDGSAKILFFLKNKSIAHSTRLLTRALNCYSKIKDNFREKCQRR